MFISLFDAQHLLDTINATDEQYDIISMHEAISIELNQTSKAKGKRMSSVKTLQKKSRKILCTEGVPYHHADVVGELAHADLQKRTLTFTPMVDENGCIGFDLVIYKTNLDSIFKNMIVNKTLKYKNIQSTVESDTSVAFILDDPEIKELNHIIGHFKAVA